MHFLARCVRGLEWVAADEITATLRPSWHVLGRREVRFSPAEISHSLLGLRTVDDVFAEAGKTDGVGHTKDVPARLAGEAGDLDWPAAIGCVAGLRPVPRSPAVEVVASLEGRRNFNRYAVENAVGEMLASRLRVRFVPRGRDGLLPASTDLTVRVLIAGGTAAFAVRLGPNPLHRRAYKRDTGPGSLHPPLAAALVRIAGGDPGLVCDPFCGDGTIPIEALLAGAATRACGLDLDPVRLAHAVANACRAGVSVRFVRGDAACLPWRENSIDAVITNPPWNVSVDAAGGLAGSLDRFWDSLGAAAPKRACVLADAEINAADRLRAAGFALFPHVQRIRIAGRISDIILTAPGAVFPALSAGLRECLDNAFQAGLTASGSF